MSNNIENTYFTWDSNGESWFDSFGEKTEQQNKIKDLCRIPDLWAIHSVDSLRLIEALIKHSASLEKPLRVFFR